jgi:hypothetical protein
MTWKHVLTIAVGGAVALIGARMDQAGSMTPVATLIIGGALGHAQSAARAEPPRPPPPQITS